MESKQIIPLIACGVRSERAQLVKMISEEYTGVIETDRLSQCQHFIDQGGIDLVLLHLFFSDSKGIQTFLKIYEKAPQLPIIVLTPLSEKSCGINAMEKGAQDALITEQLEKHVVTHAIKGALTRGKRDVLFQKHLAEVRQHNRMYQQFAYGINHDLKTPVRAIKGFSEAMIEECSERLNPTGKDYLQRIKRAALRMEDIIDALIAYGKLSYLEHSPKKVHLKTVVEKALEELDFKIKERGAIIHVHGCFGNVKGDDSILFRILTNLILNGLTFVPKERSPVLNIYAEPLKDDLILWIEDNGIGIETKDRKRIFNMFERLHSKKEYPGTGMGLSIVKFGIEQMGGSVGVTSEVDKGSRFWLKLIIAEN